MWLLNAYLIHQWFPTLSPDSPGMLVNKALFSWSSSQPTESEPLRNSLRTSIFNVSIADRIMQIWKTLEYLYASAVENGKGAYFLLYWGVWERKVLAVIHFWGVFSREDALTSPSNMPVQSASPHSHSFLVSECVLNLAIQFSNSLVADHSCWFLMHFFPLFI